MAFRRLVTAGALALFGAFVLAPAPSSADAGVEAAVMAKIRANRSGGLIVHSGLLGAARQHSMYMSSHGMNHDNADSRVRNAAPDPVETNGAPDDGFGVASWCENVTYSTGHPASEVADRLYSQWAGSGAHARCMRDTSRNVGAVGVYYDGSTWWATFIAQVDKTPPGGSSGGSAPQKTSAPKPPPAVANEEPAQVDEQAAEQPASQEAPAAAARSSTANENTGSRTETGLTEDGTDAGEARDAGALVPSTPVDRSDSPSGVFSETTSDTRRDRRPLDYGWQELAAVAAVLAIATLIAWRRARPSPPLYVPPDFSVPPDSAADLAAEVQRGDREALRERELVGAGASHS